MFPPQLFCPAHSFWGSVRRRVRPGEKLSPGLTGPSFDGKLRSEARQFGWERPERFETHSIRRGAARAMLGAGGSFAQLLKAGHWHSSAYRLYLDLGVGGAKAMASVLMEASGDGGPGRRASREVGMSIGLDDWDPSSWPRRLECFRAHFGPPVRPGY